MTDYRLVAEPQADEDVAATYVWYENEQAGLGLEFLDELRAAYDRIADGPFGYQDLRSGIRRTLLRRFPYAVYFAVEGDMVVVLAVLHVRVRVNNRPLRARLLTRTESKSGRVAGAKALATW